MASSSCPTTPSSSSVCAVLDGKPGAWPKFLGHWLLRAGLIMPGLAIGGVRDRRILPAALASSTFVSLFLMLFTIVERGRTDQRQRRHRALGRGRQRGQLRSESRPVYSKPKTQLARARSAQRMLAAGQQNLRARQLRARHVRHN